MRSTYTESQYSTPSGREYIRSQVGSSKDGGSMEAVAQYLKQTLRVGPIKVCRKLVEDAVNEF